MRFIESAIEYFEGKYSQPDQGAWRVFFFFAKNGRFFSFLLVCQVIVFMTINAKIETIVLDAFISLFILLIISFAFVTGEEGYLEALRKEKLDDELDLYDLNKLKAWIDEYPELKTHLSGKDVFTNRDLETIESKIDAAERKKLVSEIKGSA